MPGLAEQQAIFARNVAKLIEHIFESGYSCTLGEAFRTFEQAKLYAEQGKGSLNSQHCKRLAIDLNLFKDGVYLQDTKDHAPFGKYWESLDASNNWGGKFPRGDGNHYEMAFKKNFGSISFNGPLK